MKSYDVVIIGGGMCGLAAAIELSDLGLSLALVEANDRLIDSKPERVIALSAGTRAHLQSLGAWSSCLLEQAAPIREVQVLDQGQDRFEVHMPAADLNGEALGYVAQINHVQQALRAALPSHMASYCPAKLLSFEEDDDGLRVSLNTDQGVQTIQTRLLVAADGTQSMTRRLAGIQSQGWDHNRFGLVATVRTRRAHKFIAYERFCPSGPLALLPFDAEHYSIVWTLSPEQAADMMQADEGRFLRQLTEACGERLMCRLGGIIDTGARACFPFEWRQARHYTAASLALIGNAAHTLHPLGGQGLNLGMRDVLALRMAIEEAKSKGLGIAHSQTLAAYADKRMADTFAVAAFTEGVNALFSNELCGLRHVRGAGLMLAQHIRPLKHFLMRQASGQGSWLTALKDRT